MEEQLITFETAKLAKEKGFNIQVLNYYTPKGYCTESAGYQTEQLVISNWNNGQGSYPTLAKDVECSAPTQSLLQKWLREVHGIYVNSEHDLNPKGDGILYHTNWGFINAPTSEPRNTWYKTGGGYSETDEYKTYEQALEFGLQEALKLI